MNGFLGTLFILSLQFFTRLEVVFWQEIRDRFIYYSQKVKQSGYAISKLRVLLT